MTISYIFLIMAVVCAIFWLIRLSYDVERLEKEIDETKKNIIIIAEVMKKVL